MSQCLPNPLSSAARYHLEKENATFCSGTASLKHCPSMRKHTHVLPLLPQFLKGIWRRYKKKIYLQLPRCAAERATAMQQEGYSLPAHPDGHLVRKTHFMALKLAVTTATSACCKDPEQPGGRERKLAEALLIQSGGKTRTQPHHKPGGDLLGKHLSWGKGTRVETCSGGKTHTQTNRERQTSPHSIPDPTRHCRFSPDPSSRPGDTVSSSGWPLLRPHKETAWQGREQPVAKIASS